MKKLSLILTLFGILLLFCHCSNNDDLITPASITYQNNIFSCNSCNKFGKALSMEGGNLFLVDSKNVYWAVTESNEWKIKQSIPVNGTFQSLLIKDDNLFIGLIENGDIGKVKVYENTGNEWEEFQELESGQAGDEFGVAIDADAGHLVIGANSYNFFTTNPEKKKPGHVYFYRKDNGHWVDAGAFHSEQAGSLFGKIVAIEGSKAFVGAPGGLVPGVAFPGNVYFFAYYEQQWALRDSLSLNYVEAFTFSQDRLVTTHSGIISLRSFEIEENGSLGQSFEFEIDQSTINPNNPEQALQAHKNFLSVGCFRKVILFEFKENAWKIKRQFQQGQESTSAYGSSFACSDNWVAVGDPEGNWTGQVLVYPLD